MSAILRPRADAGGLTSEIARFAAGLALRNLPAAVVAKAKLCLLDAMSASLAIGAAPGGAAALAILGPPGASSGESRIVGRRETAEAGAAAFVNAVSSAATIRTDTHAASASHPGLVVVPAVLALAEEARRDGASVLAGIVAGYETMIRLGLAIVTPELAAIFRPTGLVGAPAAALGTARALGLGEETMGRAMGLACHNAAGFNEWVRAGTNEHIYHAGFAARNAVTSIRLAMAGAEAAPTMLEGPAGLLAAFSALGRIDRLTEGLGRTFLILDIVHKPTPACVFAQSPIQAALRLLGEGDLDPADIEAIEVETTAKAIGFPGCDHAGPFLDGTSRQQSIQFGIAAVLASGGVEERRWSEPASPAILRLASRCRLGPIAGADDAARQPVRIAVRLRGGGVRRAAVADFRSMTEGEVTARFLATGETVLGRPRAERLLAGILGLEEIADVTTLTRLASPE